MRRLPGSLRAEWLRHRLRDLTADQSRALLVVLGVLWGTLSLTTVLSFGEELQAAMMAAVQGSGKDLIRIWSGWTTRPHAGLPAGRWIGLTADDAAWIERSVPGVRKVSAELRYGGASIERGSRRANAGIHGVEACYGELRSIHPQPGGRFLDELDIAERRRVAFLGNAVKEILFGKEPAIGETVKLWGVPFTVVGVLRPKTTMGNYEGFDDEKVFIPSTTCQAILGLRFVDYLVIGLVSEDDDRRAIQGVYRTLGARRGFDPEDAAALQLYNHVESQRRVHRIIGGSRILLGIVGVLGLLVALIGVANVMYVLVEERRREIGVQMALGAKPWAIASGFIFEGLALTFAGGALGVLGSAAVLDLFNRIPIGETSRGYLGHPQVSILTAAAVTAILGLAGSAAGYFPARRAAGLDPVVVLREE